MTSERRISETMAARSVGLDMLDDLARCRVAAERSPVPTAVTYGSEHLIHYVNQPFAQSVDESAGVLDGVQLPRLFADPDGLRQLFDRVLESGTSDVAGDITYPGVSPEVNRATVLVQPIIDEHARRHGLVVHLVAVSSEPVVTSSRAAGSGWFPKLHPADLQEANERLIIAGLREHSLAEQASRNAGELTALLHSMTEGVTVFNQRREVVLVNSVGRTMLGVPDGPVTVADYRQANLKQLDGSPVDFDREILTPMLAGMELSEHELVFHCGDRGPRHVVLSSSVVRDGDGRVALAVGVYRDVTQLRELEQIRERYIALITHDLRGPLSTAQMAAGLLYKLADHPENCRKLAHKIDDNLGRMDQMLRNLLDAQRIRAGELVPLKLADCDLVEIARSVIEDLSAVHGDRLVFRSEPSVRGFWSAEELRRAVWNLASNGIKYGWYDSPVVIHVHRQGDHAVLAVHNQGSPIAPEDHARLFAPYTRSESAKASGPRGWGLGLTLVRGCVEAHGGTVTIDSDATRGTTFTIDLPLDSRAHQH